MFEFTPTIEDSVAFSLALLDLDGRAAKKQKRLWWAALGASVLIFTWPMAFFVASFTGPINLVLLVLVTWLLSALPWLGVTLVRPDLPRRWLTRTVRRQVKRRQRTRPLTAMRVWLDKNGLAVATAGGKSHLAWCAILGVEEAPHHVLILIRKRAGLILPKRVDPAGVAAFANQLRAGVAANPEPGPTAYAGLAPDAAGTRPVDSEGPHRWVPPVGIAPLSALPGEYAAPSSSAPHMTTAPASFPPTGQPTLTFTTSTDDLMSAVLDFPLRLAAKERLILKVGWRRWAVFAIDGLLLVVLCRLLLHVQLGWAGLGAVTLIGLSALLQWRRLDHIITRQLPVDLEKAARLNLARHGDYRRVWADAGGMTVANAIITNELPWEGVTLVETDRHVILGSAAFSVAIPRYVGKPLTELVRFAGSCGVR